ncbi:hypothetical protein MRX96_057798 [Rhipicephalus microplus]
MSRRGSKSRSAPRSRPSSPSPARSGSRGRSTSRTRSGSSNRQRSNTPLVDSHDPRLTNELKELKRAIDSLRKENAQFKQEISRLATEIAKIRKLALKPPAPPAATSSSAMDTADAPPKAGAVKRRALDSSREDETLELLSELKKPISNIQSGLSQCAPTLVKIRRTEIPISAGVPAEIGCEVWGSRPSPVVRWWKVLRELNHTFVCLSTDGNVTTSVVSFTPSRDDHGSSLACRAKNPTMAESVEEDTWTMNIQYKPKISLQLGTKLNLESIQENNDVYLECRVDANPRVDEVSWQFSGNELQACENLLVSKNFLVIQRVQTQHSGLYSCSAENSEGRTQGETLELRVKHAPLSKANQHVVYAASRHQEVEVHCEVEADPSNVTFEWRFNSSLQQRPLKSFWVEGTRSVAHYVSHSHTEYGTLLCTASNRIGKQRQPCLFHVVQAGG